MKLEPTAPPMMCPHRPPCPGCPRFGEPGIAPRTLWRLNQWAHAHGLPDVAVLSGALMGYRMRARLAIRGRQNSPKIGLFELDSHRVVHVPNCRVHHPLINHVAGIVRRALVEARITSYSDKAHLGIARYLQVVVERFSQSAQVVLVGNCAGIEPLESCFALIRERLGTQLHSLWFNAHTEPGNVILGSHWQLICGPPSVRDTFGGATVHYPPGAFGQSNLEIAQLLIDSIRAEIPQQCHVVEFYAGVGAIGLSVVEQAASLTMNEVAPQSLHGLDLGLGDLAPLQREKVSLVPGAAGAMGAIANGAEVVIVDPPRKGLDAGLREYLQQHPPRKLIYVSCGFDSLLEDAAQLMKAGAMRLVSLKAFNLMPFTEHVETLAVFHGV